MPQDLKPQQLKFCRLVVDGTPQAAAYMECYPDSARESAHPNASRLIRNDKIKAEIKRLRAELEEKDIISKAEVLQFLARTLSTPASEITPDDPLCNGITFDNDGRTVLKIPGKIEAAREINRMMGYNDPEEKAGRPIVIEIGGNVDDDR